MTNFAIKLMISLREKFNLESTNFWKRNKEKGMGFVTSEEAKKLKVKVFKDEVDKIMKQYKKIKKKEKSNISQVKKLGLVDKHGRPL